MSSSSPASTLDEIERGFVEILPRDELRARLDEVPADRPVVVYCQVGLRGHTATRILAQHGRDVRNLDGGWLTWRAGQRRDGGE